MTPKVDIHEILRHVIDNMENRVFFQNITDNGDGTYLVDACNTMWAMNEDTFEWDGNTYTISEVDPNVSFVVSGDVAFNPSVYFELNRPHYFHGTITKTNNELNDITIGQDKFPMIYCFEIFRETYYQLKSDRRERSSSLRLFFLANAEKSDWLTEDHYEEVIIPVRNMVESFINYVDNKNGFSKLSDYETVNRVDFGTFTQDNGNLKSLFTDHLSGIELDIDLEINKDLTCTLSCPCPAPTPPTCPVATYKNSDGSFVIQIASATTYTSEDIDVSINGVSQGTFPTNVDIDLDYECPPLTPCSTYEPLKTGQTTSYDVDGLDDGGKQFGRGVDFFTLSSDNPFGNTNRFTDELGGQTYTNKIYIDWSTDDPTNEIVIGYCFSNQVGLGANDWATWMSGQPYTINSFGDWYVANIRQAQNIVNFSIVNFYNYSPINYNIVNGATSIFTSTTRAGLPTYAWSLTVGQTQDTRIKTSSQGTIFVKYFTYSELGL